MSLGHPYVLFGEVCIQALSPFLIGLFGFLVLSFVSTLYILDINPLSDVSMYTFYYSVGCLFIFLMFFFVVQKFFSLMLSNLFIFSFVSFASGDVSNKILL